MNEDPAVVRESLAVLEDRADPAGISRAQPLLDSDDPYVWLNAALYIGSFGRAEAVPYLIKGLRHRAWQAHAECAADLAAITHQHFGTSFPKWREWWLTTHRSAKFDFDSNLGGGVAEH